MPKILVLGAGFSTPFLIRHLLDHAQELDATVTVADLDPEAARARVAGHERGRAVRLEFGEPSAVAEFTDSDLVVNLLPPTLQPAVARLCVRERCHMISASYRFPELAELDADARERGLALVTEMGLDPGIDLMSAQRIIEEIHGRGGRIESFLSYGGGLPEPSFDGNPLRYCITWNPRNVVMAAGVGAQFLRDGQLRMQPWHRVFDSTWPVEVPGIGTVDAYANRDSISYRSIHGLDSVRTLVRGTFRYPGFCQAWSLVVRLGLPNEHLSIPDLGAHTWAEMVEMFLPADTPGVDTRSKVAHFLDLSDDDAHLATLDAIGLFADEPIGALAGGNLAGGNLAGGKAATPAQALVELARHRLPLPETVRDMVVLHHDFTVVYEGGDEPRRERVLSTFVHYGEPGGITAMANTVGFPAALGSRMLLDGRLQRRGCLYPTDRDVYDPVLDALEAEGLSFEESTTAIR